MASRYALLGLLNIAVASASTYTSPSPAFWTVTSRFVESTSYSPYTDYNGDVTTYTDATYRTIKNTITPTATPTSTSAVGKYYDDDIYTIYAFYPTGVVAETDLEPAYDYYASTTSFSSSTAYTYMYFSMPVTMTAPESCPTPFTVTTSASVDVPSAVTHLVTPTSSEVGTYSTDRDGYLYMTATWWLSESAAPWTSTSDYYYSAYVASCSTPPVSRTGSSSGGSSDGADDDGSSSSSSSYCRYYSYYGCGTPLRTWIIIVVTVIVGLFLLGILESWFWFRRLMMGKSAMRFGTVCWILISLWVLCFTRMQDRRSPDDQKLLAEKWKSMKWGAAIKAWAKWSFRHRYPEEYLGQYSRQTVGIVPTGEPLHPAMAQIPLGASGPGSFQPVLDQNGQAVYYYGPPPPGWLQGPNGTFVPPQGYQHPQPEQSGYYGDPAKGKNIVPSAVSVSEQQAEANPTNPQMPQPMHATAQHANEPTSSLRNPLPTPAPLPRHQTPPSPPVNTSEAPIVDARLHIPPPDPSSSQFIPGDTRASR